MACVKIARFMDACELNVISSGYIFALGPLLFVSIFDVWLEQFTTKQAYVINLVSVGVVAFGCTGILSPPACLSTCLCALLWIVVLRVANLVFSLRLYLALYMSYTLSFFLSAAVEFLWLHGDASKEIYARRYDRRK